MDPMDGGLRPVLPPGAVVVRRSATQLQVGSVPGVQVADEPGAARVLRRADGVITAAHLALLAEEDGASDGRDLIGRLLARGALVEPAPLRRRLAITVRSDPMTTVFATALLAGAEEAAHDRPAITVVAGAGEPSRAALRQLCERGIAHLPVSFLESQARIGPLVLPGRTPCLDCYDVLRNHRDPGWSAMAVQFGSTRPTSCPAGPAQQLVVAGHALNLLEHPRVARVVLLGSSGEHAEDTVPFDVGCPCQLLAA